MIKIDFEFTTRFGVFKDALYIPEDSGLSDSDIEALKTERLNNWLSIVSSSIDEQTIAEGV